ncbi:fatty acid desaturase family protein [Nocardia bovistercoris]|uniref:fatty acid desaturase family protein n=1 Tax=Nocardia bovistercoris TaxID=2785916 RepID=UPI0038CD7B17
MTIDSAIGRVVPTTDADLAARREASRAEIGAPVTGHLPARGSDYAVLAREVRRAGLLHRRRRYYLYKTTAVTLAYLGGWVAFVLLGESWWQLGVAAFLAAVFAQFAFLGHDAGHRQIFASRRANYLYGLFAGNLGIGLSIGWWVSNHNRHHAHPNTEGADPDATGILAYSGERAAAGKGMRRFIFRYQGVLFFPMLLLEAGSLHYASARAVSRWPIAHRGWEGALLAAHLLGMVGVVFAVLPAGAAIAFLAVQQGLFGFYMGCTFAPNHKGMAVLTDDRSTDFLRRQVLTSRNVRGGWAVDTAMGGLNYQIEHHLFPSMPRPNLRHARPMVQDFCTRIGVPYHETGLFESYREALSHLHDAGKHADSTASSLG